jgi:flagellar secretion chaperone FliS
MNAQWARGAAIYQQTGVQCGTPLELVVKLYDAAITHIAKARDASVSGDLRAKRDGVSRALAVVSELQNSLDLKAGGQIADSLDSLYTYVTGRIVEFNVKRDVKALDEAHQLLSTLRDGWRQIATGHPGSQGTS